MGDKSLLSLCFPRFHNKTILNYIPDSELNPGPTNTVHVIGDSLISGIKTNDSPLFSNCEVHCYRGRRLADITRSVNGFTTDRSALNSFNYLNTIFVTNFVV